uniref:Uncharacterized protein n=1 Tax=Anguilla anguilla TaxID=7936 RepID=A0A0E9TKJ3_ANGAN
MHLMQLSGPSAQSAIKLFPTFWGPFPGPSYSQETWVPYYAFILFKERWPVFVKLLSLPECLTV